MTWSEVDQGVAEINGISLPLRRAFSTRRAQIEAELARAGLTGPKAARVACLTTRPAKDHTPPATLRDRWWATARRLDFHPRDLQRLLWRSSTARGVDLKVLTRAVLGPDGVLSVTDLADDDVIVVADVRGVRTQAASRLCARTAFVAGGSAAELLVARR